MNVLLSSNDALPTMTLLLSSAKLLTDNYAHLHFMLHSAGHTSCLQGAQLLHMLYPSHTYLSHMSRLSLQWGFAVTWNFRANISKLFSACLTLPAKNLALRASFSASRVAVNLLASEQSVSYVS